MTKIFRNIRQKLLVENRVTRYLLYALGEIILVVIGILIALKINNYNEERKLERLERSYYVNLLGDLKKDSIDFARKSGNAMRNEQKLLNILRFIDSGYDINKAGIKDVEWRRIVFKDTSALVVSLAQAGFVQFPKLFENTISDLKSTGNIKLLENNELKNQLALYYNAEKMFGDWNESYLPNRTQIDLVINRVLPWQARVSYNMDENNDFAEAVKLQDDYSSFLDRIKNEPELRGLVVGMIHIQYRIRDQSFNRLEDVNELIAAVSEEAGIKD